MKDTGVCPYCRKDFEVMQYGWGIPCPHCRRRVNIFPDAKVFVQTSFGICGIGVAGSRHIATTTSMSAVPKRRVNDFLNGAIQLIRYWFR